MQVHYDPAKNLVNMDKHGVSLAFGALVLAEPSTLVVGAARVQDGEEREKAIGLVEGRLWTAVFVRRDGAVRFISVMRSNDAESRAYHRHPN